MQEDVQDAFRATLRGHVGTLVPVTLVALPAAGGRGGPAQPPNPVFTAAHC
jgi:hypothetical protein